MGRKKQVLTFSFEHTKILLCPFQIGFSSLIKRQILPGA
jgi:hypothetical protein